MSNLFVLNETFTNGLNHGLLNLISLASVLCGIFVIISKNPIVSILFLIGLFLNIAGYLMMLGINFIGLSYLLVYVGAVSILFLFIMMLINVRISELTTDTSNSIPLAILIGIFFNITVYKVLPSNASTTAVNHMYDLNKNFRDAMDSDNIAYSLKKFVNFYDNSDDVSFVTSQIWDGSLAETSHITSIGNVLYTAYPIWLIITSIILLLAMVGAIVITIKQKKDKQIINKPHLVGKKTKMFTLERNDLILLILKILTVVLIYLSYRYMFPSHYIYAMDTLTEQQMDLIKQIERVQSKCEYFKEQVKGVDQEFKRILALRDSISQNEIEQWKSEYNEALTAKKETDTNLNSEQRMLNSLTKKLESGDYSSTSSSTATKRGWSED